MEKIWLKHYPKNVPYEINPGAYQSIVEIIEHSFTHYKTSPAFYNFGITLTYQQVDHYSSVFASYLQNILHLKKGDRFAIMLPNILQYPIALFGALRAGLIVVNINPLYTAPELAFQLNDAGAETIIVLSKFADMVEKAFSSTSLKNIIITEIEDFFPQPKAWVTHFLLKYIKKEIPTIHLPQVITFKDVLMQGEKLSFTPITLGPEDIAFLQYTGGTTGISKGAMLTHRNMVANILQADAWFGPIMGEGADIMITALPLYHIFSLTANCLLITKLGGLNVLITNPRNIASLIANMKKFKFNAMTGVNTLFNALLNNPKVHQIDFSAMKFSLGGGMAVQRTVAEKWQALTGMPLLEGYGLTETSPVVAASPYNLKYYSGNVGLPVPSTEVCVFDDAGNEALPGQAGELAIKGPQVMRGYWQNPQETQKVFTKEGWLLTGDIASINEQGVVRILERKKDMILVSGFNVYPNEVEDTLMRLPGIIEAAVVGVHDDNSGEAVKAFVVRDHSTLTTTMVLDFCRKNLTPYKIPKYIEFCQELPKTNVGKILRRALRN